MCVHPLAVNDDMHTIQDFLTAAGSGLHKKSGQSEWDGISMKVMDLAMEPDCMMEIAVHVDVFVTKCNEHGYKSRIKTPYIISPAVMSLLFWYLCLLFPSFGTLCMYGGHEFEVVKHYVISSI